jgi:hypothetical protein
VVIVLGKRFFPEHMQRWGCSQVDTWKRPFVISSKHPEWGADLAHQAGTSPLTVYLIREHQNIIPPEKIDSFEKHLLSTLQAADGQN